MSFTFGKRKQLLLFAACFFFLKLILDWLCYSVSVLSTVFAFLSEGHFEKISKIFLKIL